MCLFSPLPVVHDIINAHPTLHFKMLSFSLAKVSSCSSMSDSSIAGSGVHGISLGINAHMLPHWLSTDRVACLSGPSAGCCPAVQWTARFPGRTGAPGTAPSSRHPPPTGTGWHALPATRATVKRPPPERFRSCADANIILAATRYVCVKVGVSAQPARLLASHLETFGYLRSSTNLTS